MFIRPLIDQVLAGWLASSHLSIITSFGHSTASGISANDCSWSSRDGEPIIKERSTRFTARAYGLIKFSTYSGSSKRASCYPSLSGYVSLPEAKRTRLPIASALFTQLLDCLDHSPAFFLHVDPSMDPFTNCLLDVSLLAMGSYTL